MIKLPPQTCPDLTKEDIIDFISSYHEKYMKRVLSLNIIYAEAFQKNPTTQMIIKVLADGPDREITIEPLNDEDDTVAFREKKL